MLCKRAIPKLLILGTGIPGRDQHAGSVFYLDLCRHYPKEHLSWFGLVDYRSIEHIQAASLLPPSLAGISLSVGRKPRETGISIPDRILRILPLLKYLQRFSVFIRHYYTRQFVVPKLIDQVVQFARQQGVEIVLVWLCSPTIIYMAEKVASKLHVPLLTNVQDPPERAILGFNMDRVTSSTLLDYFAHALQSSLRCGTASEGMQAEYLRQYGVNSVVLIHGLAPSQWHPPAQYSQRDEFVIGFAGNMYAKKEWISFLEALSSVGWSIGDREIKLRVLMPHLNIRSADKMHIEYLGWRSLKETLDLLARTDVTYLPYWFDKDNELAVKQCFPNKLSTYLAAGRPVFYHGPTYSSVARILKYYPAGYSCYSLDSVKIVEGLKRLALDEQYYKDAVYAGREALRNELNLGVFLSRFAALLGIETHELAIESMESCYNSKQPPIVLDQPEVNTHEHDG